jgi:myo-inositol-1(or 4)-monophosphatase
MYDLVIKKVKELGLELREVSGNVVDLQLKKTVVTEWDLKIENEISEFVKTFPGEHSIYAEELHSSYIKTENIWVMDPISNTFNFIHGLPHYSIAVSHIVKGVVTFAVVYDPSTDEMFFAEKGKGTFLNEKKVSVSKEEKNLTILVGPHLNPKNASRLKIIDLTEKLSEIATLRTFGSVAVHYAYVACGRADVAVTKNHDTFPEFAGKLLVEEAGGMFTDFSGGELDHTTSGVIASNRITHSQISSITSAVFEENSLPPPGKLSIDMA